MGRPDRMNASDAAWQRAQSRPAQSGGRPPRYGMAYPGPDRAPGAGAPYAPAAGAASVGSQAPIPYVQVPQGWQPDAQAQAEPAAPAGGYAQMPSMQAASGRPMQMPSDKKKRRKWPIILIIAACLIAAALLFFLYLNKPGATRQGTAGQLEGKTAEEIQAELDRVVDEGMFNISIANVVSFPDGTSPGELRIENVPGNHYLMKVTLTLDDTGQQVYETDLIEPNFHIQADTLDVDLPAGNYQATALFGAYDMQTEEQVGQAAAKILIEVVA